MSKCISSHGEYSEHESATDFTCELCGVFDERAALDRIETLDAALAHEGRMRDEAEARADRAEARLARVTELCESQTEGIRAEFKATGASPARDLGYADACDDVLSEIRAVAADEQEAPDV